jgi:glycosyltransferase involved in cell wall biosynthesis
MLLSVVILTKNEAHNLRALLPTLSFADEVVVIDSGSDDDTVEVAKSFNAQVVVRDDWQGFAVQRNRGAQLAHGQWVLQLDADERVSDSLAQELLVCLSNTELSVFRVPRLTHFLGRGVRYGGWYPDYTPRLYKKDVAQWEGMVHERLVYAKQLSVGKLKNHLLHWLGDPTQSDPMLEFERFFSKLNGYSSLAASQLHLKGKTSNPFKALVRALIAFIKIYVFKLGFMDGKAGLVIAFHLMQYTFYKHVKLFILSQKNLSD